MLSFLLITVDHEYLPSTHIAGDTTKIENRQETYSYGTLPLMTLSVKGSYKKNSLNMILMEDEECSIYPCLFGKGVLSLWCFH